LNLRGRIRGRLEKTAYNGELHNLYASPNIITASKSRMIWVGQVARMGTLINAYSFRWKNLKGRCNLGNLRVDGRIILK
jgi:hypothetical protein